MDPRNNRILEFSPNQLEPQKNAEINTRTTNYIIQMFHTTTAYNQRRTWNHESIQRYLCTLYKVHKKTNTSQAKAQHRPYRIYGNQRKMPKVIKVNKRQNPLTPSEEIINECNKLFKVSTVQRWHLATKRTSKRRKTFRTIKANSIKNNSMKKSVTYNKKNWMFFFRDNR